MKTKLKQFSYTKYYKNIELTILCVTSSRKKFAELSGLSLHEVANYAHSYEPRDQPCIDNPDKLYAKLGLGGEGRYVFDHDQIYTYEEFKLMIDKHRETYSDYRTYLKMTGNE